MKKEPKTNKGKYNAIITKAEQVSAHLDKLAQECRELAEMCREFGDSADYDTYIYNLQNLEQTAEDLAGFDFVDAIPDRARFNW